MTMLDYIMEQPKLFQDVLKQSVEITSGFCEIFKKVMPDQLYLIASGTSCNGAKAAAPFMEMVLGCQVHVYPPSRMNRIYGQRPLVLLISQGGKSTNIVAAAEKTRGYSRIAMTGSKDGILNSMCENYIVIPCGEENVGPKTKGYTITILTLYLMALEAAKAVGIRTEAEYTAYKEVLETCGRQYEENIKRSEQWVGQNKENLKALRELYLVGKGQSMFVAQEGALKMMETCLIPGTPFDFEEYLHGPACSLRDSIGGIYLLPPEADVDYIRMQKLVNYHRNICEHVFTIGLMSSGETRDCLLLSTVQWYTKPFEEILPLQLISAMIPELLGIEGVGMDRFKALDEVMDIKHKEQGK